MTIYAKIFHYSKFSLCVLATHSFDFKKYIYKGFLKQKFIYLNFKAYTKRK